MATQGPPPPREGVDLATLFISAIASAAAAYITSKIWAPGTLVSAAFTPVIVALVKEGLRKPTQVITNVVPTVAPSKWTRAGADDPGLVVEQEPVEPETPAPVVLPTGGMSEIKVHSTRGRRLRWRLAVVTGLLGFGIAVLAFTVPELIAGQSIGGSHKTTIFGGHHTKKKSSKTKTTTSTTSTSTQKTTTTETTPTETTTVTQTETVTTPQTETTTPSTATPQSSAAPQSTAAPGTTETP
ncbi:hypothetical protein [Baekduia sp. Peel2402]|uniref:hypothetical protein n=1 Tax=Baekduia sp. Peel2402 TaxID=3458296 RepID=UPI00403E95E8